MFVTIKTLKYLLTVFHLPTPLALQVDQYNNNIIGVFCIHKSSFIPGQIHIKCICIVVVDPDQLIGTQVVDMILNKPGMIIRIRSFNYLTDFSFLIRYYSLLYQSLIPNCKLTINTLRQHMSTIYIVIFE